MSTIRLLFCLLYKVGNILAEKEEYVYMERQILLFIFNQHKLKPFMPVMSIIKSTFNRSPLVNMPNHLLSAASVLAILLLQLCEKETQPVHTRS